MKIGYPCLNLTLGCSSSRTFRLSSYSDEKMRQTVDENLSCLGRMLEFNAREGLLFFRITSDLVPFASHPVCTFPWQEEFAGRFEELGAFIRENRMRVSMHPDQFNVINSPDESVFSRTVRELSYHAGVLDLLGAGLPAKIQVHVGGAYLDKDKSKSRFIDRFRSLPGAITRRLVIENDDRTFGVDDCLYIHDKTGVPVVFDTLHFRCLNGGEKLSEAFFAACGTWEKTDGPPIVDYSSQDDLKRPGGHAGSLDARDFFLFLEETAGHNFDIMMEIKDKEKSAVSARRIMEEMGFPIEPRKAG